MPVNYRIDPDERFVYLTTVGESSLAEWTEAMLAVLSDSTYQPGFNFLSDRREESDVPDTEFAKGAADFLQRHHEEMGHYRWLRFQVTPPFTGCGECSPSSLK